MKSIRILTLALLATFGALSAHAQAVDPATQAKIDAKLKDVQAWAASPAVVAAVKAHNTAAAPETAGMTQDKWASLSVLDPVVRAFNKNEAAAFLKGKKDESITEAFISGNDGTKVAFLSKPTSWSHKGKEKHDAPMGGKTWQGGVEVDASTGLQQIQVAVPVLEDGKPVGSLVVGLSLTKLSN